MDQNKSTNIISLITYKHTLLCKALAWLLIITFSITNLTYGYDRNDNLRAIYGPESGNVKTTVESKFYPVSAARTQIRTSPVKDEGAEGEGRAEASRITADDAGNVYAHPLGGPDWKITPTRESLLMALDRLIEWLISKGYENSKLLRAYQTALKYAECSQDKGFVLGKYAELLNPYLDLPQVVISTPKLYDSLVECIPSVHDLVMFATGLPREAKGLACGAAMHNEINERHKKVIGIIDNAAINLFESHVDKTIAQNPVFQGKRIPAVLHLLENLNKPGHSELAEFLNKNHDQIIDIAAYTMVREHIEALEHAKTLKWARLNKFFNLEKAKLAGSTQDYLSFLLKAEREEDIFAIEMRMRGISHFRYWLTGNLDVVRTNDAVKSITFFMLLQTLSFLESGGRDGFDPEYYRKGLSEPIPVEAFLAPAAALYKPVSERAAALEGRISELTAKESYGIESIPSPETLLVQLNELREGNADPLNLHDLDVILNQVFQPQNIYPMYYLDPNRSPDLSVIQSWLLIYGYPLLSGRQMRFIAYYLRGKGQGEGSTRTSPAEEKRYINVAQAYRLIREQLISPERGFSRPWVEELLKHGIEVFGRGTYWLVLHLRGLAYVYKMMWQRKDGKLYSLPIRYRFNDHRTNQELSHALNKDEEPNYPLAATTHDLSEGNTIFEEQERGLDLEKLLVRSRAQKGQGRMQREEMVWSAQIEVVERLLAKRFFLLDASLRNIMYAESSVGGISYLVPKLFDFDELIEFKDKNESNFVGQAAYSPRNYILRYWYLLNFVYSLTSIFVANRNKPEIEQAMRSNFIRVAQEKRFVLQGIVDLLQRENWPEVAQLLSEMPQIAKSPYDSPARRDYRQRLAAVGLDSDYFRQLKRQMVTVVRNPAKIKAKYRGPVYSGGIQHSTTERILIPEVSNSAGQDSETRTSPAKDEPRSSPLPLDEVLYQKIRSNLERQNIAGEHINRIINALRHTPREEFIPIGAKRSAYRDIPLSIEEGQMISRPSLVAYICALLDLSGRESVLEVGAGSGWLAAILGDLLPEGRVDAVERLPRLVALAKENLAKVNRSNVYVIEGDGTKQLFEEERFDRIVVSAGAKEVPQALIDELKVGGIIIIPVAAPLERHKLQMGTKINQKGEIEWRDLMFVRFVPLVSEEGHTSPVEGEGAKAKSLSKASVQNKIAILEQLGQIMRRDEIIDIIPAIEEMTHDKDLAVQETARRILQILQRRLDKGITLPQATGEVRESPQPPAGPDAASRTSPVALIKQEGERLRQELGPLLDELKQLNDGLSPQEPLQEETKATLEEMQLKMERLAERLFAFERCLRDDLDKTTGNRAILLEALDHSIMHYIGNSLNGVEPAIYLAIKYNALPQENITFINKCIDDTNKIIECILSVEEIYLNKHLNEMHIPGLSNIEGFPKKMVSFEAKIQTVEPRDGPFGDTPPDAGTRTSPVEKGKEDDYIIGRTLKAAYEAHQKDPTGGIVRPVGPKIITKVLTILSKIAKLDCPIAAKIKEKLEELRKAGGRINIVNYPNLTRSCVSSFGISIAHHLDMTDKDIESELLHQAITGCIFGDKHKVHELADTVAEAVSQKRFKDAADIVLSRVNIGIWVPELKAFPHLFSLSHFKLYRWVYAYLALTIISAISAYCFLSANNLLLAFLSAILLILLIVSWNIGCRTFKEINTASTKSFFRRLEYLYSPQRERDLFLLNEDQKALWEIAKGEDILSEHRDDPFGDTPPNAGTRTSPVEDEPEKEKSQPEAEEEEVTAEGKVPLNKRTGSFIPSQAISELQIGAKGERLIAMDPQAHYTPLSEIQLIRGPPFKQLLETLKLAPLFTDYKKKKDVAETVWHSILNHNKIRKSPRYATKKDDDLYVKKLQHFIDKDQPIELFFIGFPFKMPSPLKCGNRIRPDMGELLAIANLINIHLTVQQEYGRGVRFIIPRESFAYRKFYGVTEEAARLYFEDIEYFVSLFEKRIGQEGIIVLEDLKTLETELGDEFRQAFANEKTRIKRDYYTVKQILTLAQKTEVNRVSIINFSQQYDLTQLLKDKGYDVPDLTAGEWAKALDDDIPSADLSSSQRKAREIVDSALMTFTETENWIYEVGLTSLDMNRELRARGLSPARELDSNEILAILNRFTPPDSLPPYLREKIEPLTEIARENAFEYLAYDKVKYRGGRYGMGIMQRYPYAIPVTLVTKKKNKFAIHLIPTANYLSHHGVAVWMGDKWIITYAAHLQKYADRFRGVLVEGDREEGKPFFYIYRELRDGPFEGPPPDAGRTSPVANHTFTDEEEYKYYLRRAIKGRRRGLLSDEGRTFTRVYSIEGTPLVEKRIRKGKEDALPWHAKQLVKVRARLAGFAAPTYVYQHRVIQEFIQVLMSLKYPERTLLWNIPEEIGRRLIDAYFEFLPEIWCRKFFDFDLGFHNIGLDYSGKLVAFDFDLMQNHYPDSIELTSARKVFRDAISRLPQYLKGYYREASEGFISTMDHYFYRYGPEENPLWANEPEDTEARLLPWPSVVLTRNTFKPGPFVDIVDSIMAGDIRKVKKWPAKSVVTLAGGESVEIGDVSPSGNPLLHDKIQNLPVHRENTPPDAGRTSPAKDEDAAKGNVPSEYVLFTKFPEERDRNRAIRIAKHYIWTLDEKLRNIGWDLPTNIISIGWFESDVIPDNAVTNPIYEMALNIMMHGKGGSIDIQLLPRQEGSNVLQAVGVDNGPGIESPAELLRQSLDPPKAFRNEVLYPHSFTLESKGGKHMKRGGWGDPVNMSVEERRQIASEIRFDTTSSDVNNGAKITMEWSRDDFRDTPPPAGPDSAGRTSPIKVEGGAEKGEAQPEAAAPQKSDVYPELKVSDGLRVYYGNGYAEQGKAQPGIPLLLPEKPLMFRTYQSPLSSGFIHSPNDNDISKPTTIMILTNIVNLIKSAATNAARRIFEKSSKVCDRASSLFFEIFTPQYIAYKRTFVKQRKEDILTRTSPINEPEKEKLRPEAAEKEKSVSVPISISETNDARTSTLKDEGPEQQGVPIDTDFEITEIIRTLQNGPLEQKIVAAKAVKNWTLKPRSAIPGYEQAMALVDALQSLVVTRDQEISYALRSASEGAKAALEFLICAHTSRYNMAIRDLFFPLAAPFVKVADLPTIWGERQQKVRSVDQLKIIVDPPLVKACRVLFEKGITTTFSSANGADFMWRGYGSIEIYSKCLSGENLEIADDLEREGILEKGVNSSDPYWTLKFPFDANTSVWDLSERAARVVERFHSQSEVGIRTSPVDGEPEKGEAQPAAAEAAKGDVTFATSNSAPVPQLEEEANFTVDFPDELLAQLDVMQAVHLISEPVDDSAEPNEITTGDKDLDYTLKAAVDGLSIEEMMVGEILGNAKGGIYRAMGGEWVPGCIHWAVEKFSLTDEIIIKTSIVQSACINDDWWRLQNNALRAEKDGIEFLLDTRDRRFEPLFRSWTGKGHGLSKFVMIAKRHGALLRFRRLKTVPHTMTTELFIRLRSVSTESQVATPEKTPKAPAALVRSPGEDEHRDGPFGDAPPNAGRTSPVGGGEKDALPEKGEVYHTTYRGAVALMIRDSQGKIHDPFLALKPEDAILRGRRFEDDIEVMNSGYITLAFDVGRLRRCQSIRFRKHSGVNLVAEGALPLWTLTDDSKKELKAGLKQLLPSPRFGLSHHQIVAALTEPGTAPGQEYRTSPVEGEPEKEKTQPEAAEEVAAEGNVPLDTSNITFEGASPEIWIKISEDTYLVHEAISWFIRLNYMSDSELGAETIGDSFKQWHQGERAHFYYVNFDADKKIFEEALERIITMSNKNLPYYNWFRDNRRRILESVEKLFVTGNIIIDGHRAVSLLATRADELRYFLVHEYFHRALVIERILSGEEIQLLQNRYSLLLQQASKEELIGFLPGYEQEFQRPDFWDEFFAQCFYRGPHPASEFWKMNASGEIYFDLEKNHTLVVGMQYLKEILLSKYPFLKKVNQRAIEKANSAIEQIEKIVQSSGTESPSTTGPDTTGRTSPLEKKRMMDDGWWIVEKEKILYHLQSTIHDPSKIPTYPGRTSPVTEPGEPEKEKTQPEAAGKEKSVSVPILIMIRDSQGKIHDPFLALKPEDAILRGRRFEDDIEVMNSGYITLAFDVGRLRRCQSIRFRKHSGVNLVAEGALPLWTLTDDSKKELKAGLKQLLPSPRFGLSHHQIVVALTEPGIAPGQEYRTSPVEGEPEKEKPQPEAAEEVAAEGNVPSGHDEGKDVKSGDLTPYEMQPEAAEVEENVKSGDSTPNEVMQSLHIFMFATFLGLAVYKKKIDYNGEFKNTKDIAQCAQSIFKDHRVLNIGLESDPIKDSPLLTINNLVTYLRGLGIDAIGLDPQIKDNHVSGYRKGYTQKMPFGDDEFDDVISCLLFNMDYIDDIDKTGLELNEFYTASVSEIKRVLKDGGRFFLILSSDNPEFVESLEKAGFEKTVPEESISYYLFTNRKSDEFKSGPPGIIPPEQARTSPVTEAPLTLTLSPEGRGDMVVVASPLPSPQRGEGIREIALSPPSGAPRNDISKGARNDISFDLPPSTFDFEKDIARQAAMLERLVNAYLTPEVIEGRHYQLRVNENLVKKESMEWRVVHEWWSALQTRYEGVGAIFEEIKPNGKEGEEWVIHIECTKDNERIGECYVGVSHLNSPHNLIDVSFIAFAGANIEVDWNGNYQLLVEFINDLYGILTQKGVPILNTQDTPENIVKRLREKERIRESGMYLELPPLPPMMDTFEDDADWLVRTVRETFRVV